MCENCCSEEDTGCRYARNVVILQPQRLMGISFWEGWSVQTDKNTPDNALFDEPERIYLLKAFIDACFDSLKSGRCELDLRNKGMDK